MLLKTLERDGFIPKDEWRISEEEVEPKPEDGERVVLASHILGGLGFPPFFSKFSSTTASSHIIVLPISFFIFPASKPYLRDIWE